MKEDDCTRYDNMKDNNVENITNESGDTVVTVKKKLNLICIISFLLGLAAIVMSEMAHDLVWCCIVFAVAIIGLILSFIGRINTKKTQTRGNGLVLAAMIMNLVMAAGVVLFVFFNLMGYNDNTLMNMIIGLSTVSICAVISVAYGIIAKKSK